SLAIQFEEGRSRNADRNPHQGCRSNRETKEDECQEGHPRTGQAGDEAGKSGRRPGQSEHLGKAAQEIEEAQEETNTQGTPARPSKQVALKDREDEQGNGCPQSKQRQTRDDRAAGGAAGTIRCMQLPVLGEGEGHAPQKGRSDKHGQRVPGRSPKGRRRRLYSRWSIGAERAQVRIPFRRSAAPTCWPRPRPGAWSARYCPGGASTPQCSSGSPHR